MNITVTGRHVDITDSMKEHAKNKVLKLEKYAPGLILDAHIIMDIEKYRHIVEITLKGKTFTIHAKEETGDMYSSIDILISKLEKKLRSIKEKLQDHHKKSTQQAEKQVMHLLSSQLKDDKKTDTEKQISIIYEKIDDKPLFVEDAIIKLQESHNHFLAFLNAETNKVNVVYKKSDQEVGVIEP